MNAVGWLLMVLLIAFAAASAWLWSRLSRASAELAAARGAQLQGERQLQSEQARAAELTPRLDAALRDLAALRERIDQTEQRHAGEKQALIELHQRELASERRSLEQYRKDLETRLSEAHAAFKKAIDDSANAALKQSAEHLLKLTESKLKDGTERAQAELDARKAAVEQLVKPIGDVLKGYDEKVRQIEKDRAASFAQLGEQAGALARANETLRRETSNLVQALRKPHVRGNYGEMQLRRVVELIGMRPYCDFTEQHQTIDADGRALKPDMIVRMPGGRTLVVDAKTNIEAYLDALDADDRTKGEEHLERFARHVSQQVAALSRKGYWSQYEGSPEMVLMFMPGDQFVDAALSKDPEILTRAKAQRVILVSPGSLFGLLQAVNAAWLDQDRLDQTDELLRLGRELHHRVATALEHASDLGKHIDRAAVAFNKLTSSMERNLATTARRFEELGSRSEKEIPSRTEVVTTVSTRGLLPTRADDAVPSPGATED